MKKILQITSYYTQRLGGVDIYLNNLGKFLKKKGFHSWILAPGLEPNIDKQKYIIRVESSQNSKIFSGIQSLFSKKVAFNIFSLIKILIKEHNNFDIFSIHSFTFLDAPIIIFFLRFLLRRNIILTIHGLNENIIEKRLRTPLKILDLIFWRSIAWVSILMSNRAIFVSLPDKNKMKKMFPSKIHRKFYLNPNSISSIELKNNNNQNLKKKYFTFIGRLTKAKGFDIFIDIMFKLHILLKQKIPLLILGTGPLDYLLCENNDKLEIKHFQYIDHDNISQIYNQTKVFLLTSRTEGLATTLLEVMYFKIPVIATDIPSNRQIIIDGYNGLLFPLNQLDIAITKINKILDNELLKTKIIKNGRKTIERDYLWEKNIEKFFTIYDNLIKD